MKYTKKQRPEIKDYERLNDRDAYQYVLDLNGYINYLEKKLNKIKKITKL